MYFHNYLLGCKPESVAGVRTKKIRTVVSSIQLSIAQSLSQGRIIKLHWRPSRWIRFVSRNIWRLEYCRYWYLFEGIRVSFWKFTASQVHFLSLLITSQKITHQGMQQGLLFCAMAGLQLFSFPPAKNRLLLTRLILKPTAGHHSSQFHSAPTFTVFLPNVFTPSPWPSNSCFPQRWFTSSSPLCYSLSDFTEQIMLDDWISFRLPRSAEYMLFFWWGLVSGYWAIRLPLRGAGGICKDRPRLQDDSLLFRSFSSPFKH